MSIFHVECVQLQDEMLAALNTLLSQLVDFINEYVTQLAFDFIDRITQINEDMDALKSTEFSIFAEFCLKYQVLSLSITANTFRFSVWLSFIVKVEMLGILF